MAWDPKATKDIELAETVGALGRTTNCWVPYEDETGGIRCGRIGKSVVNGICICKYREIYMGFKCVCFFLVVNGICLCKDRTIYMGFHGNVAWD